MPTSIQNDTAWLTSIEQEVEKFCSKYRIVYAVNKRERSAAFEIGCLHMLLRNYESVGKIEPQNLLDNGAFRYLTTPSGNPDNFSWIKVTIDKSEYEIRQQVRVKSHWHEDIAFCPDMVVLKANQNISSEIDENFANGKRPFYSVSSESVISAHECKSLSPFPELLVSFVGMFQVAHKWYDPKNPTEYIHKNGKHLAPCLFIGGDTRALHFKMIQALEQVFPINIVTGLHYSRQKLRRGGDAAKYIDLDEKPSNKKRRSKRRRRAIQID